MRRRGKGEREGKEGGGAEEEKKSEHYSRLNAGRTLTT